MWPAAVLEAMCRTRSNESLSRSISGNLWGFGYFLGGRGGLNDVVRRRATRAGQLEKMGGRGALVGLELGKAFNREKGSSK